MKIFIGMETSGELRRRFAAQGPDTISCDTLSAEDVPTAGVHIRGDVFETLDKLMRGGWTPDLAVFHPTCTFHTLAAAWAFADPDYDRFPGVGYHQKVKPGTLTGVARRAAREEAEADAERIRKLPFKKIVENPKGTLPTRTGYKAPSDVLQPYEFGDDASKATCLWVFDEKGENIPVVIPRDPDRYVSPRLIPRQKAMGKSDKANSNTGPDFLPRWANQTDTGQNRLSPGDDRWKDRSRTYPGIADAIFALAMSLLSPVEDVFS